MPPPTIDNTREEARLHDNDWGHVIEHGDVDTPILAIDGPTVSRNVHRMANYCRSHNLGLRPHAKTHKMRSVAQLQLDWGAIGLTVAKPDECRMFDGLPAERLLAYPAITPSALRLAAEVVATNPIMFTVDSSTAVEGLARVAQADKPPLSVLVDVDVGMHRTGVSTTAESLLLAQQIDLAPNLCLAGVFCYPGHIWDAPDRQTQPLMAMAELLSLHLSAWSRSGIEARIVSAGSTPTAFQTHWANPVTEIRAGTYVFNDLNTVRGGFCEWSDCAARVIATVVSTAVSDQVVLDCGSKVLGVDRCIPQPESGFGHLPDYPAAIVAALSEEHAQVDVSRCDRRPKLGQRVQLIPNHICPVVNLADKVLWFVDRDTIATVTIDARGKVT